MRKLTADGDYLEQLASEQDEAGAKLNEAVDAVDGRARRLTFDHGLICSASVSAMKRAEQTRADACTNMIAVSADLAEKLRLGADAYAKTDVRTGRNLDRQVLSE